MLKSAIKQNCRPLSWCRWYATNQKLSKAEGSFENWTTLRQQNCHQSLYDRHSFWQTVFIASWITTHTACRHTTVL